MNSPLLKEIIGHKKAIIRKKEGNIPLRELRILAESIKGNDSIMKTIIDLNKKNDVAIVCEYKPASPSKGHISDFEVSEVVKVYQNSGAAAISILTEENYFNSSLDNLVTAKKLVKIPLILKDFIINPYQIYEARYMGASSILLMTSLYPDLKHGIELCRSLDLEPLVECSNHQEILQAIEFGAEIIGINNRNFKDLNVDLERTAELAVHVPNNKILVSESGVNRSEDVSFLANQGADVILVGSSLMASPTPKILEENVKSLINAAKGARRSR